MATLCALAKVKHWSGKWEWEWEECVRVGAVDGAVAPFEPYLIPDFGSSTTSTKAYSGKRQLAGQGSYI